MKFRLKELIIVSLVLIFLVGFVLFGLAGVKTLALMFLFFLLPFYLLFGFFNLDFFERVLFGFFTGIAFFPLILWFVDRLLHSLLLSAVVAFVLLAVLGFYLDKKGKGDYK